MCRWCANPGETVTPQNIMHRHTPSLQKHQPCLLIDEVRQEDGGGHAEGTVVAPEGALELQDEAGH